MVHTYIIYYILHYIYTVHIFVIEMCLLCGGVLLPRQGWTSGGVAGEAASARGTLEEGLHTQVLSAICLPGLCSQCVLPRRAAGARAADETAVCCGHVIRISEALH